MYMTSFHHHFPEIARMETRSVSARGVLDLPDGEYGFFESYCDDPTCDCRRVLINVYRSDNFSKIWATINYGWESVAFYRRWLGSSGLAQEAKGPTLDPLYQQSEHALALLNLFKTIVQDDAYVQRLKRHYALMKGRVKPVKPTTTTKVKRGRRIL
jgi:hypothetical protein